MHNVPQLEYAPPPLGTPQSPSLRLGLGAPEDEELALGLAVGLVGDGAGVCAGVLLVDGGGRVGRHLAEPTAQLRGQRGGGRAVQSRLGAGHQPGHGLSETARS